MWQKEGIPSRGTLINSEAGPMNLMRFSKAKCKVLHLGQGNPRYVHRLGELIESSPVEKDLGGPGGRKALHKPAVCSCSQKVNSILG